jgi:hypothetical protein
MACTLPPRHRSGRARLSVAVAQEAGLEPVASVETGVPGHTFAMHLGVLDSFQMGDIELRNIPCMWFDAPLPAPPGGPTPVWAFGTNTFYHFLTTMDFAGQALILRRKTRTQLRQFATEAATGLRARCCGRDNGPPAVFP